MKIITQIIGILFNMIMAILSIIIRKAKRLARKIFFQCNLIVAILTIAIKIGSIIPPTISLIIPFISLAYPLLLLINIIFIIAWALSKYHKFLALVSIIAILIGGKQMFSVYQICEIFGTNHNDYKIMTFNCNNLGYYDWRNNKQILNNILDMTKSENPDVICLQEYLNNPQSFDTYNALKNLGYEYDHTYYSSRRTNGDCYGIITLSKYPIVSTEHLKFDQTTNSCHISDIAFGNDTVRIYNCHLESFRLHNDEINEVYNIDNDSKHNLKLLNTYKKMYQTFCKREKQAKIISKHIKKCQHPLLVCGDFNDVPTSYTYHTIRSSRDLDDAFVRSGVGFGGTYEGKLPAFKIDYILFSDKIKTSNYHIRKEKLSDHRPSFCTFSIN